MKALLAAVLLAMASQMALAGQGQAIGHAWRSCVEREFGKAWVAMLGHKSDPDDNGAVEMAFLACQTEQDAVYAAIAIGNPHYAGAIVANAKLHLKQHILTGH